jgi:glycopeptide antibiotics resistance protein
VISFPRKDVTILLIEFFPFPFLVSLFLLTAMIVHSRKRGWAYIIVLILFGVYIMAVVNFLFFPIFFPGNWPANLTWKDTMRGLMEINLIPFYYARIGSISSDLRNILYDIAGNILLTIPFGLGFCFLTKLRDKRIFWVALSVGLFLEGAQLLMKLIFGVFFHSVDINDVLFNALGVVIGWGLYLAWGDVVRRVKWPIKG